MIYKGMQYTVPATALAGELTYAIHMVNVLTVNGKADKMVIDLNCSLKASSIDLQYHLAFENLVINGHTAAEYDQQEWLFAKLFSINNELIIRTDPNGSLSGVGDKNTILAQWELTRADISNLYENGGVIDLLENMDYTLKNNIKTLYNNDSLLNLLFNGIYQTYVGEEPAATQKILLKHFGQTPIPIIEYKELTSIDKDLNTATIEITAEISELFDDTEGMNNYLAEITGHESDDDIAYYFDYQGVYEVNFGTEHYINKAELFISGHCDGYEKRTEYTLTLLNYE